MQSSGGWVEQWLVLLVGRLDLSPSVQQVASRVATLPPDAEHTVLTNWLRYTTTRTVTIPAINHPMCDPKKAEEEKSSGSAATAIDLIAELW